MNHTSIGKVLMSWARMAVTYCSEIRTRRLHSEAMSQLSRRQLEDIGQEHYHELNKRRERGFSNMIDFRW